jgi:hypothetical protein
MNAIFADYLEKIIEVLMDDFSVYGTPKNAMLIFFLIISYYSLQNDDLDANTQG